MVVQTERRMVLEIEDGQVRGEVASQDHGGANSGVRGADTVPATFKDLGLNRRRMRQSLAACKYSPAARVVPRRSRRR
jgi:hypothetical protein